MKQTEKSNQKNRDWHKGKPTWSSLHPQEMSEMMKGDKNPFYGKHHTKENRKKIIKNLIKDGSWWLGRKQSEKSKQKNREAKKKNPTRYWLGKHLPEEMKRKIRITTRITTRKPKFREECRLRRLKQKLPTIDTSIELKVKKYLDDRKINYIHPFNLGNRFQCDFYIPFLNLIVECDGSYWHSLPENKRRDKAKDAYAKECGFNILRLTEKEINKGNFEI